MFSSFFLFCCRVQFSVGLHVVAEGHAVKNGKGGARRAQRVRWPVLAIPLLRKHLRRLCGGRGAWNALCVFHGQCGHSLWGCFPARPAHILSAPSYISALWYPSHAYIARKTLRFLLRATAWVLLCGCRPIVPVQSADFRPRTSSVPGSHLVGGTHQPAKLGKSALARKLMAFVLKLTVCSCRLGCSRAA